MLGLEITHGGGVDREIAGLSCSWISLDTLTHRREISEIPVATARADARMKESCMVDVGVIEVQCAPEAEGSLRDVEGQIIAGDG